MTQSQGVLEWMYGKFVWEPKTEDDMYNPSNHFRRSRFSQKAYLLGTFYDAHGEDDLGPVYLSGVGWAQMVTNIVKIELFYNKKEEKD